MRDRFYSIYSHGIIRAAVCLPSLRVARPDFNLERTLVLARQASKAGVAVALFPELGLSAYSNDDLFHQDALLDASKAAVGRLVKASEGLAPVLVVGAPLRFEAKLFNCAVVIYRGRVLGLVPKTYLPNYREYYEKRQFASSRDAVSREVLFLGERVPFGNDLIFEAGNVEGFQLHAEICEDVWTPDSAEHLRRAGGSDGAGEPFGQQHHHRQGGIPAQPVRLAIGQVHRRLSVFVRRAGRIHHRPRLGRPCADLRERRPAGRVGAVCGPRADDHRGH